MSTMQSVLIVEDEMIIAANIALQLNHLGYQVNGIIPRAEEVLPHIKQQVPDILLMDINLKGEMDGIELAGVTNKVTLRADDIKQVYFQDPNGYWIEVNSIVK